MITSSSEAFDLVAFFFLEEMHSIQCARNLGPRMELDGGVRTGSTPCCLEPKQLTYNSL